MKGPTPKQERFAQEYFRTGNACEAYRLSYNCSNMKTATIARKAVEVLHNGTIRAIIDRYKATVEKRVTMTKEQAIARLADIALQNEKDRVAALKQLGKIMGWEAPTRQQIEAAFTSPFERFIEAVKEPETEPDSGD